MHRGVAKKKKRYVLRGEFVENFRGRITRGIYFTEITVLECARGARVKFEINSIPGFCGNGMVVEVRVQ